MLISSTLFLFLAQDPCSDFGCLNGGKCNTDSGLPACDCAGTGFTGDKCQESKLICNIFVIICVHVHVR